MPKPLKKLAAALKQGVGQTPDEEAPRTVDCAEERFPVLRATPEYRRTKRAELVRIAIKLCLSEHG